MRFRRKRRAHFFKFGNNVQQAQPACDCLWQIEEPADQLARNPFPTISLELEISMKAWGST